MPEFVFEIIHSPFGDIAIKASNSGLTHLAFQHSNAPLPAPHHSNQATNNEQAIKIVADTKIQLAEYFSGERNEFNLPLAPKGTPFQNKVWRSLLAITKGQTVSYIDIAKAIDNPKGVRAVGTAIGKNPIALIIPCHRIIGKSGKLTGYAGGLALKAELLNFEGASYHR